MLYDHALPASAGTPRRLCRRGNPRVALVCSRLDLFGMQHIPVRETAIKSETADLKRLIETNTALTRDDDALTDLFAVSLELIERVWRATTSALRPRASSPKALAIFAAHAGRSGSPRLLRKA